jgi:hypothetical protein
VRTFITAELADDTVRSWRDGQREHATRCVEILDAMADELRADVKYRR